MRTLARRNCEQRQSAVSCRLKHRRQLERRAVEPVVGLPVVVEVERRGPVDDGIEHCALKRDAEDDRTPEGRVGEVFKQVRLGPARNGQVRHA